MNRRAKVICTIGPSSDSRERIFSLIRNGMDVARLNFSHGDYESHGRAIEIIREGSERYRRPVAILQDLMGVKIRIGNVKNGNIFLKKGKEIFLMPGSEESDEERLFISYPNLIRDARKGEKILLDDGLIQLEILAIERGRLKARVIEGGILRDKKGVNLPFRLSLSTFTEKDARDLEFGLEKGVDYVALSFVKRASDIRILRKWLDEKEATIPIIAKIERPEAVMEIEEILNEADGIMIARGDLGVEVKPEEVPLIQKRLIGLANRKGKIVITATQMLDSMREHLRPTRAEATDVANAIIDGSDALMLSGETASGRYPVESLRMMNRIIEYTERNYPISPYRELVEPNRELVESNRKLEVADFSEAVADAACRAAEDVRARCIVAFTHSGFTARLISKFRPTVPIIAFTPFERVRRIMSLFWGVRPEIMRTLSSTDEMIKEVEISLLKRNLARRGEVIVITASIPVLGSGRTNMVKLHRIGEGLS
ncbi:MAG: pyruvate kinase [Thermodesulfovibrionales bacterium]